MGLKSHHKAILQKTGKGYKDLAAKGAALLYPVSVGGKTHTDQGIEHHATIKFLGLGREAADVAHGTASETKFGSPDASKIGIEPDVWKDRFGDPIHVLKLVGEGTGPIHHANRSMEGHGPESPFEFTPHVSVDEDTWNRIKESGAKTAQEAGIEFRPPELRVGKKTVASYGAPKKLASSEMEKGVMQRVAPFNPEKDVPKSHRKDTEQWTEGVYHAGKDPKEFREQVPHMVGAGLKRALHRLHGKTKSRRNPNTGDIEYLLHRGVGSEEHKAAIDKESYEGEKTSSWTPHYHKAFEFAKDYAHGPEGSGGDAKPGKPKVVSAWVPASNIRSIPSQMGEVGQKFGHQTAHKFAGEHEVIVNPGKYAHASSEEMKGIGRRSPGLQERISRRAQPKTDLAASEDDLDKGLMDSLKGAAIGATMGAAAAGAAMPSHTPKQTTMGPPRAEITATAPTPKNVENPQEIKYRTLNAISQVESSGGKDIDHDIGGGIHGQERAYGKYGLMPMTIRHTISSHDDLKSKYGKLANLRGQSLHEAMKKHPGLEDEVASRHYDHLASHFGHDPKKVGMAWLQGVRGTYRMARRQGAIDSHWRTKKILDAYHSIADRKPASVKKDVAE